MTWSPQQDAALKAVSAWAKTKGGPQVFRLFGYAGTGKTTMAKEIAKQVGGSVLFATFTGKASLVLRSKGCDNTSTIHSLIYRVVEDDETGQPKFALNRESMLGMARLLIVDECSMVDEKIGVDLLGFGTKILVLGDPAQLPPVSGTGFFTDHAPDIMLTEVHRQARDNPIIRLSMDVREGKPLEIGRYGESAVLDRSQLEPGMVSGADQVLVGLNKTRRAYNARLRVMRGIESGLPVAGDRLVCLRNDQERSLLNGGIWEVMKADAANDNNPPSVLLRVKSMDEGGPTSPVDVHVPEAFFLGSENGLDWRTRRKFDEFDFGYVLTVHKAQGSQWGNVVLFDESRSFRDDASRWLYTGITRAADKITVVV